MTAFYMFRLWFLTFAGEPRDHHRYDHAHESPREMVLPLVILATFAVIVAWGPEEAVGGALIAAFTFVGIHFWMGMQAAMRQGHHSASWLRVPLGICAVVGFLGFLWGASPYAEVNLSSLIEQARPAGTLEVGKGLWSSMSWPDEHASHAPEIKVPVTIIAFSTALGGVLLAAVFYFWRILSADDVRRQFSAVYQLLWNKWWFDELYDWFLVRPTHLVAALVSSFDRRWIDGFIDGMASIVRRFANLWDAVADRGIVDGLANGLASATYATGLSFRRLQTGRLRQYVMFIAVGTIAVFVLISFFWGYAFAS